MADRGLIAEASGRAESNDRGPAQIDAHHFSYRRIAYNPGQPGAMANGRGVLCLDRIWLGLRRVWFWSAVTPMPSAAEAEEGSRRVA
jgi:hypothetical protein